MVITTKIKTFKDLDAWKEGHKLVLMSRQSYKEKLQFYSTSQGSVTELQNQLAISKDVNFIDQKTFSLLEAQTIKVHKILNGLIRSSKAIIHNS